MLLVLAIGMMVCTWTAGLLAGILFGQTNWTLGIVMTLLMLLCAHATFKINNKIHEILEKEDNENKK